MRLILLACLLSFTACSSEQPAAGEKKPNYTPIEGFVDLFWDAGEGRLLMKVDAFDTEMIYQTALTRGLGSNDIGLDRGQLGNTRIVKFMRSGPRVLMVAPNLDYRAGGDNPAERLAVEESFAVSVLWGFEIESETDGGVLVDATDFIVRDVHGVAVRLERLGEGSYKVDATRSAVYLPETRAFPDNTNIEATVTFTGEPTGDYLPTVAPDPRSFTLHMRHAFIRLPDDNYEPLAYDPRAGVIALRYGGQGFADYASPIGEPLHVNYGLRHRLEKVDPDAEISEAIEPIVYYLDAGAPEPVRSALLEGARWWNQAFEAAGYENAFRVEMLPEGADPLDVRYNVIQWVHRSTRGWSYGSSVIDPRTGEILKGHVSLGSLRVRQDYLIAEGLLAPYDGDEIPPDMLEMSLARIRQLSAHEVGHTIGFTHNFAASTQDRASVMDYPFPLIRFGDDGELDLSDAYDDKIGAWDKRSVLYAYQDFPDDVDDTAARRALLEDTIEKGFAYVADADSRSPGTAHPDGNLWDNGSDAIAELAHLTRVREHALTRFSDSVIRSGRSLALIEEALVPIYLLHRFQIEAVGKLIGGRYFNYALKGDGQQAQRPVALARQSAAVDALIATLSPSFLALPDGLAAGIPPRPPGVPKTRESFSGYTGHTFDAMAPARASASLTLDVMLHPDRAARLARQQGFGLKNVLDALLAATWFKEQPGAIERQTSLLALNALLELAINESADPAARATALDAIERIREILTEAVPGEPALRAHYAFAARRIERVLEDPSTLDLVEAPEPPPGSPIGAAAGH